LQIRSSIPAKMRGVADSAGDFSDCHLCGGGAEAGDVALVFSEPVGDLQSEGNRSA